MNNLFRFASALAAAAALFAGCQKADETVEAQVDLTDAIVATYSAPTKVVDSPEGLVWEEEESIAVSMRGHDFIPYYLVQLDESRKTAWFRTDAKADDVNPFMDRNIAFSPLQEDAALDAADGAISHILPAVQEYDADGFLGRFFPMAAVTEHGYDTEFAFKNICGVLVLQLTGAGDQVETIILRGNNGEPLHGAAVTRVSADEAPAIVSLEPGDVEEYGLTLDCSESEAVLGEEVTKFWFVIPPTTFEEGITVEVITTDGYNQLISTENEVVVGRSEELVMDPVEIVSTRTIADLRADIAEIIAGMPEMDNENDDEYISIAALAGRRYKGVISADNYYGNFDTSVFVQDPDVYEPGHGIGVEAPEFEELQASIIGKPVLIVINEESSSSGLGVLNVSVTVDTEAEATEVEAIDVTPKMLQEADYSCMYVRLSHQELQEKDDLYKWSEDSWPGMGYEFTDAFVYSMVEAAWASEYVSPVQTDGKVSGVIICHPDAPMPFLFPVCPEDIADFMLDLPEIVCDDINGIPAEGVQGMTLMYELANAAGWGMSLSADSTVVTKVNFGQLNTLVLDIASNDGEAREGYVVAHFIHGGAEVCDTVKVGQSEKGHALAISDLRADVTKALGEEYSVLISSLVGRKYKGVVVGDPSTGNLNQEIAVQDIDADGPGHGIMVYYPDFNNKVNGSLVGKTVSITILYNSWGSNKLSVSNVDLQVEPDAAMEVEPLLLTPEQIKNGEYQGMYVAVAGLKAPHYSTAMRWSRSGVLYLGHNFGSVYVCCCPETPWASDFVDQTVTSGTAAGIWYDRNSYDNVANIRPMSIDDIEDFILRQPF